MPWPWPAARKELSCTPPSPPACRPRKRAAALSATGRPPPRPAWHRTPARPLDRRTGHRLRLLRPRRRRRRRWRVRPTTSRRRRHLSATAPSASGRRLANSWTESAGNHAPDPVLATSVVFRRKPDPNPAPENRPPPPEGPHLGDHVGPLPTPSSSPAFAPHPLIANVTNPADFTPAVRRGNQSRHRRRRWRLSPAPRQHCRRPVTSGTHPGRWHAAMAPLSL